jgi:hypothetical protein
LELSEHELKLNYGSSKRTFALSSIKTLDYRFNRRLASLVTGGIIAPFSVLAYFKLELPAREMLLYLVLGMALLFHGWRGRYMFMIETNDGKKEVWTTFQDNQELHQLIKEFYNKPRIRL